MIFQGNRFYICCPFFGAPGMARGARAPYVQLWWLSVDLEVQVLYRP